MALSQSLLGGRNLSPLPEAREPAVENCFPLMCPGYNFSSSFDICLPRLIGCKVTHKAGPLGKHHSSKNQFAELTLVQL
jgi:hypothetical protein